MGLGWKDEAVESIMQDQFDIGQYINGLCEFIKDCETPMTIAIQGDWGSGKTSVMNMVKQHLGEDVISVWFNTWQFSQFAMGDDLAIVFLNYLSKALCKDEPKFLNLVSGLGKVAIKVVGEQSERVLGSSIVTDVINEKLEKNAIDIIKELKDTFQETVNDISKKSNGKRVVFYIDDLDRLQPLRAVELLEVLKIFLDCENCVFVLAIDYEVVSQGIKEKYKNTLDERKSRKFFEKIIQVPFKMPVAHYNIDKYIADTLKNLGIEEDKYAQHCANLIRTSIGYNPRAMKRTFNAYLLLTKVHSGKQEVKNEYDKLILFGSLCMQLVYEDVYNYLVSHLVADDEYEDFVADATFFQSVLDNGVTQENSGDELYNIVNGSNEYDEKEIVAFLQSFAGVIRMDKDSIDESAMQNLLDILQMTSVTAAGNVYAGNNIAGRRARKEKFYDENFKQCTINALETKEVKSFNAAEFEWYQIGETRVDCTKAKFKFADFIKHAMEYAYEQNPGKFDALREEAINSEKGMYSNLFCRERTKHPESFKILSNCGYEISTHTSNDAKVGQVRRFYENMGIDGNRIKFSMKEAHNV